MLVITGIVYIGLLTAVITAKIVEVKFRRGITMSQVTFEKHILLCGWIGKPRDILEQLFAPDRKDYDPVVIIDPKIEEAPMDHPLLAVIRGDPTEAEVLRRANVEKAKAAIILADRTTSDPNVADARNLLIVLAIESLQREVYTTVEVLNPANAVHFRRVNVDEVISVSELSHALVVQAALNPGTARLITDMLTFGEGEELYREPVPPQFIGKTFADLATELMRQRDIVLVGVATRDGHVVRTRRARWRFQEGDTIFLLSEAQPRGLERLCPPEQPAETRSSAAPP